MIPKVQRNITQDRWLAGADIKHTDVHLVTGGLYRFHGMEGPKRADGTSTWEFPPGDYRCLGVGKNVRTFQEMVAYEGEDGLFFCTLSDWAENFSPVSVPASVPEAAGKPWRFFEGHEGRDG